MRLSNRWIIAAALGFGICITGCGHHKKKPDPVKSVSGVVATNDYAPLSPEAIAYVRLADVTRGDVRSQTVVQQSYKLSCCGTVPFELTFKEKLIDPGRDYALDVRVVDKGELVYITRGGQPVLTKGNPNALDLKLELAGGH